MAGPFMTTQLDNGLRVVLSPDHTAPTVTVAVYYNIGFRIEPRDRTGFAHLFEHMMFQGSRNLGKMEFIQLVQENGGVLNGSTRFDFTNYFEIVPAHMLETMLWAEADRMKGLAVTQENLTNQQGVVKNEVKVNVLNQPYEGFPWLDMPQLANENWYNAHNFYGDLEDLDAATRPAIAIGYHMPERNTPEYWAMGLIDQILLQGDDSRLTEVLVKAEGVTGDVQGGINDLLGNMYNYEGPMLWLVWFYHDADTPADSILALIDEVIEQARTQPVDAETLARARVQGPFGVVRLDRRILRLRESGPSGFVRDVRR